MRTARRVVYRTLWQGSTMNLDSHLTGQSGVNCKFITPPASQRRRTRVYRKARARLESPAPLAEGQRRRPSLRLLLAVVSSSAPTYLRPTTPTPSQRLLLRIHTHTHTYIYIYIYIYIFFKKYIYARTTSSNTSSKSSSKPATIPTTIYTIYCY